MKYYIALFSLLFLFVSCEKANNVNIKTKKNGSLTIWDWQEKLEGNNNDGFIRLNASSTYTSQNLNPATDIQGHVLIDNARSNEGIIEFGQFDVNPKSDNKYQLIGDSDLKHLFGTNVGVKIKNDKTNLLLPDLLIVENPNLTVGSIINPNFVLNWTPDQQNHLGVLIKIAYIPTDNSTALYQQGYTNTITNYVLVDDNGSYNFELSDFNGIPDGGNINVTISRGGFGEINMTDGRNVVVYGTTSVMLLPMKYDAN